MCFGRFSGRAYILEHAEGFEHPIEIERADTVFAAGRQHDHIESLEHLGHFHCDHPVRAEHLHGLVAQLRAFGLGQLDEQVKKFLSRQCGFRIDKKKKRVCLSAILQPTWYGKEFISKYGTDKKFKDKQPAVRAVLNFVTNYITKQDISFLETKNYSVKFLKYDWTLNK